MKSKGITIVIILVGILFVLTDAFYTVDETEQVVITQFGRIIGNPVTEPGLNFKLPFLQKANLFPKNLLDWDGDPGQIPTLEKTYIWVDTFARWKIIDPVTFFQTVNNIQSAYYKLNDIIDPAVRNAITSNRLIETVRKSNRELDTFEIGLEEVQKDQRPSFIVTTGREEIVKGIFKEAQPKLSRLGIELVDVKIKRINYVKEVQQSVFGRMIAERKQIAEKFRSEGKGEATKIRGEKERELKRITSEAYRTAQELKGKADAESTVIYAKAYGKDPEFYSFVKTLDIYKTSLDEKNSLILSTDSEFLKYLKGYSK